MRTLKQKNEIYKKTQAKTKIEKQIVLGMVDIWDKFNKSPEERQKVLDWFDQAKRVHFADRPHIVEWFEGVRKAFLESEELIKNGK